MVPSFADVNTPRAFSTICRHSLLTATWMSRTWRSRPRFVFGARMVPPLKPLPSFATLLASEFTKMSVVAEASFESHPEAIRNFRKFVDEKELPVALIENQLPVAKLGTNVSARGGYFNG